MEAALTAVVESGHAGYVVVGDRGARPDPQVFRKRVFCLERGCDRVVGAVLFAEAPGGLGLKLSLASLADIAALGEAEHVLGVDFGRADFVVVAAVSACGSRLVEQKRSRQRNCARNCNELRRPSTCEDEFRPKTRRHGSPVRSIQTARTGDGTRDDLDQRQELGGAIREIGYRGLDRYGGRRTHPRRDERDHNGIECVRENPSKVMVNGAALVPNIAAVALMFVMERGAGFSEVELRASLIECVGRMERKQWHDPHGLGDHEKPKQPGSTASHRPPNGHAKSPEPEKASRGSIRRR